MKKFINVICITVAFIAVILFVSSCGKAKEGKGTNLYNYIPNDYMAVAKIDSETLMKNEVIKKYMEKILDEVSGVINLNAIKSDLDVIKNMIIVFKTKDFSYGLINLSVNKEEFLKRTKETVSVTKIKIGDKEAYEYVSDGKKYYSYFIDSNNAIIAFDKDQLTEVVNQFSVATVTENFKNNKMLKKNMVGLEKYPVWMAFHDSQVDGRVNFSIPTADSKVYNFAAEFMSLSEKDYNKEKQQFPSMKYTMIDMVSNIIVSPELLAKLKENLKFDFDDASKRIKVNFSFDPAAYEGYTEKLIKLGNQQKQVPGVMTK